MLKKYKNIHKGQRCFIIGTGPSLSVEDLEKLKGEITFGSNRIFEIYSQTDWRPTYYMNQDKANIFIPYAGLSNLGVYRFSQYNHQIAVGVDCIDPNSFSHIHLSMNKKMDLALDDFLQLWIKGDEIPRHTFYTLESGRVTVDRHSILDADSEILDQLFEQAIAKEKEYYQNSK